MSHGGRVSFSLFLFGSLCDEPMQSCSVHCVVLSVSALLASVYSCPSDISDHRNFISCQYMPLVYGHEIFDQCDIYFLNGSHFSKFIYVALLSIWLCLKPSYYASVYNILKVMNFSNISHFALYG